MKLYNFWKSSCSWRVRAALAYKGIDYEYAAVDIGPKNLEQDAEGFEKKSAMRQPGDSLSGSELRASCENPSPLRIVDARDGKE